MESLDVGQPYSDTPLTQGVLVTRTATGERGRSSQRVEVPMDRLTMRAVWNRSEYETCLLHRSFGPGRDVTRQAPAVALGGAVEALGGAAEALGGAVEAGREAR